MASGYSNEDLGQEANYTDWRTLGTLSYYHDIAGCSLLEFTTIA
jgi:hypothetical protein